MSNTKDRETLSRDICKLLGFLFSKSNKHFGPENSFNEMCVVYLCYLSVLIY